MLPSGWVTFAFTDIEASTRLALRLGAGYRPVLRHYRRVLGRAVRTHGGVEVFTEGDSCFAAFPDAAAALSACRSAQRALAVAGWPAEARPRVRMGLHSGRAQPRRGEYASPEVHRAARVTHAAHGGQVLCSRATARSAAPLPDDLALWDLGLHRLRGFDGRERLFQLVAPGWEPRFPRPRTEQAPPHNLPAALTTFVGRRAERAALGSLLSEHRLVTVIGGSGAGKSRLAVQVAGEHVDAYPDGVWFVDLAAATGPAAAATTATLGLHPGLGLSPGTALDLLAARQLLLVLDACDEAAGTVPALLSRLLATGPEVRVLATGRAPIGIPGEVVWRIPPLSSRPGPDGRVGDALALLLDRAVAARGGRAVDSAERVELARVATRLAGSPLELERAAARLRVLTAGQMAARLAPAAPLISHPVPVPVRIQRPAVRPARTLVKA